MQTNDPGCNLLFPARLKALRLARGASQKLLSLELKLDPAQYSAIESGRRPPLDSQSIDRLVTLLGWSPAERQSLLWTSVHDRAIRSLIHANIPVDALRVASSAMRASHHLSPAQVDGLIQYLAQIEESSLRLIELQPAQAGG
jgi:transcriptional regulator with XRE-family HTH domain